MRARRRGRRPVCRSPPSSAARPTSSSPRRTGRPSTSRRASSWRPGDMAHVVEKAVRPAPPACSSPSAGRASAIIARRRHARPAHPEGDTARRWSSTPPTPFSSLAAPARRRRRAALRRNARARGGRRRRRRAVHRDASRSGRRRLRPRNASPAERLEQWSRS